MHSPDNATATAAPPCNEAELCQLVLGVLQDLHPEQSDSMPQVSLDSSLDRDLGFDSLSRMELLLRIEAASGLSLPEDTLETAETLADLWQAVQCGRCRPTPPQAASRAQGTQTSATPPSRDWASQASTLLEVLDEHVAAHPDRIQIVYLAEQRETPISYRQLHESSLALATGLQCHGLRPGQTVAIMLPTSPEYFFTYLGILRAGGIPVPIYPPARPSQLEDHVRRHTGILSNARASLLVSVPAAMQVSRLLQARVPGLHSVRTAAQLIEAGQGQRFRPLTVRAEDIAFIQYTSGSTGQPKGVALTHANLLANIRAMASAIQATPDDIFVSWLPLYHDMGLIGAWLGSFTLGFRLVVMSPLAFLGSPRRWLEAISRHGATLSAGPNFAYELCLKRIEDAVLADLDLSRWRLAFNGAEAVSADTVTRFSQRFAPCGLRATAMTPVYGLAEASVGLLFPPLNRGPRIDAIDRAIFQAQRRAQPSTEATALRFVACGHALPGHAIRIVDDAGHALPERIEGRLEFRGPSATQGYWHAPEQTARLFRDDQGEWLDSGDRAYLAEGDVFVTGRIKDIIIRAGRNLYPQEIEAAVGQVEGVRKGCVVVFGRQDARSGTERLVVLAEVSPRAEQDKQALRDAVAQAVLTCIGEPADDILLAAPHTVLKTSSGKVRRSACRALVEQGGLEQAHGSVRTQWLRLVAGALQLRLRHGLQRLLDALFGLRAQCLFWLLAPGAWLITLLLPNQTMAWGFCHRAARMLLRLAGLRLEVQGLHHLPVDARCVLVSNHASYLDGLVLIAALARPLSFVAKRELQGQWFAGPFLKRLGTAFVERFDPRRSVADAQQMAAQVQAGRPLLLFPEGTFVEAPGLLPFRPGGFLAAADAGVPVLPISLAGTRQLLADNHWWPRKAALTVCIGAPLMAPAHLEPFAAAVQLRDRARRAISLALATSEA